MINTILQSVIRRPRKRSQQEVWPLGFILPAAIFILLIYIFPLIRVFILSFERVVGGQEQFVGMANYVYVLTRDPSVKAAIYNNLRLLMVVPILVGISVLVAILLFENVRGTRFFQAAILIPYLVSIPTLGLVLNVILRDDGPLNFILRQIGLSSFTHNWLGDSGVAIYTIMGVVIWRELGLGSSLFLAQLLTVPEEIFDAAKVDGTNWFQMVLYIVMPQLGTMMLFYGIYNVIIVLCWTFNYVYIMTYGGPAYATMVMEFAIYLFATAKRQPGMAAALSVILFLSIFGFVVLQTRMRQAQFEEVA